MSGLASQTGQRPPNLYQGFIRPENLMNLPHLNDDQKKKYHEGVIRLWEAVNSNPADHPEHVKARQKLSDFTIHLKNQYKAWNEARQAGQQTATRPSGQSQSGPSSGQQGQAAQQIQQGQQGQQGQRTQPSLPQQSQQNPPSVASAQQVSQVHQSPQGKPNQPQQGQQHQEPRPQQQQQQQQQQQPQQQPQQQQQQQQQQQPQQQQLSQTQAASGQPQVQVQSQGRPGVSQNGVARPANQPAAPNINQMIAQHVQSYQYVLPPDIKTGSPEADKWLLEAKNRFGTALSKQKQSENTFNRATALIKQLSNEGKEVPDELKRQQAMAKQSRDQAAAFISSFSKQQAEFKQAQAQIQGQSQGQTQPQIGLQARELSGQQVADATTTAIKQEPITATPTQTVPPSSSQQVRQPSQVQQLPNQQPQTPAMESARPQVSAQGRLSLGALNSGPAQQQQLHQQGSTQQPQPLQAAASQPTVGQPPVPQQGQPTINRPPGMPQQASAHFMQGQQQQQAQHVNSPQTATGMPQGPPVALTHQQASQRATEMRNNIIGQNITPQPASTGMGYQQMGGRDISAAKMPIPKQLNIPPQQPVSLGPARPTMGGPNNAGPGMMNQPGIVKAPGFIIEGEGERVLSKRKLDELVRQVTGGGEGPGGEGLTQEVEEAVLQLADEFVDNVISSACRLAKLRQSSTLDIRDLQLILERNYNIRIPGYASDEVRTVRKFQPAAGWTQKMNAVQAAKVMGGKGDI